MSTSGIKIYDKVADIYPHLMKSIRYDKWAKYISEIAGRSVKRSETILELGAGNGRLAGYLKKYYPHIIITDLSSSMLRQDRTGCNSRICCNMTRTPFKTKFNFIYSAFDSVNYLTSRDKLLSFFKEINRILNKAGIFTFDVSLEGNSMKHIKEPIRKGKYKGISFVQKSKYSPGTRIHQNIFRLEAGEDKFYELHRQKIYPFEEYFKVIGKAALYVEECFDAFTFDDGNAECERVQFVVRK
jgi:ubiquinone/menaquinone biosynthesis C-methylase UbiE